MRTTQQKGTMRLPHNRVRVNCLLICGDIFIELDGLSHALNDYLEGVLPLRRVVYMDIQGVPTAYIKRRYLYEVMSRYPIDFLGNIWHDDLWGQCLMAHEYTHLDDGDVCASVRWEFGKQDIEDEIHITRPDDEEHAATWKYYRSYKQGSKDFIAKPHRFPTNPQRHKPVGRDR